MNELQICKMQLSDTEYVSRLEELIFSVPWSKQSFIESLNNENTLYYLAKLNDKIAGYCGMYYVLGEGEITNVAVSPKYRNLSIGYQMLRYLLTLAQKMNINKLVLEVRVSNAGAIHLYHKLGFQIEGIRRDLYEKPKEDGYIMRLDQ